MRAARLSVVLALLSSPAFAGPRESLELPVRVTGRDGANDVVGAARVGLTVALLAHQREPKVLRAERVWMDSEPLWRVDVAGHLENGGCAALGAWIAEDGRIVHLSQISELTATDDCREWYFNGDALAEAAASDVVDPVDFRGAEPSTRDGAPVYRVEDEWGDGEDWGMPAEQWDEWRLEQQGE